MQTIHIIEDDPNLSEALSLHLIHEGYNVERSIAGDVGLKTALEKHPDLILLDILLPSLNGTAILSSLRKDPWGVNVPIIIITNLSPDEKLLAAIEAGKPDYFLIKSDTDIMAIASKIKTIFEKNKHSN